MGYRKTGINVCTNNEDRKQGLAIVAKEQTPLMVQTLKGFKIHFLYNKSQQLGEARYSYLPSIIAQLFPAHKLGQRTVGNHHAITQYKLLPMHPPNVCFRRSRKSLSALSYETTRGRHKRFKATRIGDELTANRAAAVGTSSDLSVLPVLYLTSISVDFSY